MSLTDRAGSFQRTGEFAEGYDRAHDFAGIGDPSRRGVQLVDLAMWRTWAALIAWVLLHR